MTTLPVPPSLCRYCSMLPCLLLLPPPVLSLALSLLSTPCPPQDLVCCTSKRDTKCKKFICLARGGGGKRDTGMRGARRRAIPAGAAAGLGELHCRRCMASQPAPSQRAKRSQLKNTQSLHVVALSDQLRPAAVLDGLPAGGLHDSIHPHVADGLGGGELNLRAGRVGRQGRGGDREGQR